MGMLETSEELDTWETSKCSVTSKFGVLAGEKIDETIHIEQHGMQSYAIGDATDIAVQRSHTERQNPKSTSKDK